MLVVMLPAYNESEAMGPLLERIAATFKSIPGPATVLVVDDGSTDGTASAAAAKAEELGLPLQVAAHERNQGLGAALRTGFVAAHRMLGGEGVLVVMDADNTHDPAVIPAMLAKIEGGLDVVIASRYARGGREIGLSPVRRLMSRGASIMLAVFLPVRGARDYSCGYRAYRGSAIARAFDAYGEDLVTEQGFVSSAEILIKIAGLPARVGEVPLVLRYDLKGGASKMKVGQTVGRYFLLMAAGRRALARRTRSGAARVAAEATSSRKEAS
jgi:dolichol-phosphate mannosyltransferase